MTAAITAVELERFERDGYLMVPDAIDPARWIEPVMQEYEAVLDRLAGELFAAGRIGSVHDDLPFDQRFVEICAETNETNAQYFDFRCRSPTSATTRRCGTGRRSSSCSGARGCSTSWSTSSGLRSSRTRSSTSASRHPSRASRVTRCPAHSRWAQRAGTRTTGWSCRRPTRRRC